MQGVFAWPGGERAFAENGEISAAVAVEVTRHEGGPADDQVDRRRGAERPVAVAQQHLDPALPGRASGDGEVGAAIAVEVTRHEVAPTEVAQVDRRRGAERPVAVAQQHLDLALHGRASGDDEVGAAIAVEVTRHEGLWGDGAQVDRRGAERPVAVAQQHRHRTGVGDQVAVGVEGAIVGNGQIGAAIAVEVTRHEGLWVMVPRSIGVAARNVPSPSPSSTSTRPCPE